MSPEPEPLPPPPQRAPNPKPKCKPHTSVGYDQESAILKAPEVEGSTEDGAANKIAAPEDLDLRGMEDEDDLMDFTSVPDLHGSADTSGSNYISVVGMDIDAENDQSSEAAFKTPAIESDGSSYWTVASDSKSDLDYEAALEEGKRSRRADKALKTKNEKKQATAETKKIQKWPFAWQSPLQLRPMLLFQPLPINTTYRVNKRAKGPDLGGLRADFKIALKKAGAPTLANTSNDLLIAYHMGKFDHEETAESVNTAHEAKQAGAKASTVASQKPVETQVCLVPTNVNVIDAKERCGNGKCSTFNKTNLPISTTADHCKWDTKFMPTILDFVGAQELQFGMSNNLELKALIQTTWTNVFPLWIDCKDDPAIAGFTQQAERKKEGKGRVSNNNKDGFGEDPWAEHIGSYYNLVKSVSDSKWMTIFEATEQFINVHKFEKRQPVSDPVADARMMEQEDKLVMWE
ncbi:hypothetical protein BT96DRAFT_999526 [Gymnopus androsaceus JB14]|uniref:Uncharacterized protein n=1 Tax=Gymnopus androsaceus JB14 TaxID=1447944 RepID=A0A6A4H819_9AGAR|nr:hypothetical protein BT96DRAFT_999526 [Gymnopus androsaceus JB14]